MKIMIDLVRIRSDKGLNDLNWEIIENRGIATGDTVALWEVALELAESAAVAFSCSLDVMSALDFGDLSLDLMYVAQSLDLMSKFLARDAREIVKFLDNGGFEFPEGYIGRYDGGANDLSGTVQY